MEKESVIIISVGGSLLVSGSGIDEIFIGNFKKTILKIVKKLDMRHMRFVIVCGGGEVARGYQNTLKYVNPNATDTDLDWIGIQATRLNAQFIAGVFGDVADQKVIGNPSKMILSNKPIVLAGGWKPGCSTDYGAVLFAKNVGAHRIINLTNVDGVYDKDPNVKNVEKTKIFRNISWDHYLTLIPYKWTPGLSSPFDPIASREAKRIGLEVVIMNGNDLTNMELCLSSSNFKGTTINNLGHVPNLYPYVNKMKKRRIHRIEDTFIYE